MKTAISIPDGVFKAAERLARRLKITRSELYATALAAFLERHAEAEVTNVLNEVYAKQPSEIDPVLSALQSATLSREDW
jgi:predicted transcriptional regulator